MPVLRYRSAVREAEESFVFTLKAQHNLEVGGDGQDRILGRLPAVDICLDADLVLSVTGLHHKRRISGHEMEKSFPVQHLSKFLKSNASELGLSNVSDVYVDAEDGLTKVTLSSALAYRRENSPVRLSLGSIDLVYQFRPGKEYISGSFDMFSEHSYLPYHTLLDRVLAKFTDQLFRCYPLIFGSLGKRLAVESIFLSSISRSLSSVIRRSEQPIYQKKSRRIVKILNRQCQALEQAGAEDLSRTGIELSLSSPALVESTDVINRSLLQLLRLRVRPSRFKGSRLNAASDTGITPFRLENEDLLAGSLSLDDNAPADAASLKWEDLPFTENEDDDSQMLNELLSEDTADDCHVNVETDIECEDQDDWLLEPSSERPTRCAEEDLESAASDEWYEERALKIPTEVWDDPLLCSRDDFRMSPVSQEDMDPFTTNSSSQSHSQRCTDLDFDLTLDLDDTDCPMLDHDAPSSADVCELFSGIQEPSALPGLLHQRPSCGDSLVAEAWSESDFHDDFGYFYDSTPNSSGLDGIFESEDPLAVDPMLL
ncbi:hypothetical protein NM688_g659 [Phlebia brevispora]|uniref:Uncharacterized protein n=1 Tax=Phlebia brevispora TaxID=194682 RepID=A0ACC1TDR5_9APHY|nr:hypothetical protein NM688_g659 [Phlebia brevispora]